MDTRFVVCLSKVVAQPRLQSVVHIKLELAHGAQPHYMLLDMFPLRTMIKLVIYGVYISFECHNNMRTWHIRQFRFPYVDEWCCKVIDSTKID